MKVIIFFVAEQACWKWNFLYLWQYPLYLQFFFSRTKQFYTSVFPQCHDVKCQELGNQNKFNSHQQLTNKRRLVRSDHSYSFTNDRLNKSLFVKYKTIDWRCYYLSIYVEATKTFIHNLRKLLKRRCKKFNESWL